MSFRIFLKVFVNLATKDLVTKLLTDFPFNRDVINGHPSIWDIRTQFETFAAFVSEVSIIRGKRVDNVTRFANLNDESFQFQGKDSSKKYSH